MLKNYLRSAIRNLLRNRLYSTINIAGLTIGLTACLLVATVVINDLSYDTQWKNAKNIARVISNNSYSKDMQEHTPWVFTGMGPALKQYFPEVTDYCRADIMPDRLQLGDGKDGFKTNLLYAEPSIWNVFDFAIQQGTPQKFLPGYPNLVITEKYKQQYFPHTNPIGTLVTNVPFYGDAKQYIITGVIKDIPANTHLYADAILLHEFSSKENELPKDEFSNMSAQYLLLKPGTDIKQFAAKINTWYAAYLGKKPTYTYSFQPLTDVHLRSAGISDAARQGSIQNVYIFSGVAALLLLIGCINFINLTTARALKRMRETGIRKVLGAGKKQLTAQFLFESILFFCIAFVLSLVLYNLFIPSVETFLQHKLVLSLTNNISLFGAGSAVLLLVSLFTGLYPALVLSRPQPAMVLKSSFKGATGVNFLRKGLVTMQFVISITIIIAAVIVQYQLHFINHKNLGFDKNNLFNTEYASFGTKAETFKQAVLQLPEVEKASISGWAPSLAGGGMSIDMTDPANANNKIKTWYIDGDVDLVATLKIPLEQGRYLNPALPTDYPNIDSLMKADINKMAGIQIMQPVLVTAYTAKRFGIKKLNVNSQSVIGLPVGILKDFNNESLKEEMHPCVIRAKTGITRGRMLVRVKPGTEKTFLAKYGSLWQKFYPGQTLQFNWVNNMLDAQYKAEQKLQQLFMFFSYLTVFLACLGLFGLTTFTAEQKTKEIGIRKVVGASVFDITALLSIDFLKLVVLAVVIASPVAGWLMSGWLQNFAYRVHIEWWIFALVGGMALIIAFATISFQAIKAAMANPVESLREG